MQREQQENISPLYLDAPNRARQTLTLLLLTAPWGGLLAWLSHVAWFLCDDAFISFRYARNLLEGHGLVFNPGEYVEGYSNFLWTLELALLWALFDLRPEHVAPWLSVACTLGTIAAMLWWVIHTPRLQERRLVAWMAMGLVCSSATFAVWTSAGGLETRQFTLFIVLTVVCLGLYRHSPWGLLTASLCLTAAAYTRPEGPLFAACCFAWFALQYFLTNRRLPWRELLPLVMPFILLVASHYLWRYSYYGEWLPNTYYAKYVRPWYDAGARYLVAAALETGLYLFLPLACLALWTRWQAYGDGTYGLVLLCVVVHMAYVMRIGGDLFEYRPLDFYWPLLAVPAAAAIVQSGTVIAGRIRVGWTRGGRILSYQVWALLLFFPVLFYANTLQGIWLVNDSALLERLFQQGTAGNVQNVAPTESNEENTQRLHAGLPGTTLRVLQRYRYLVPPGLLQIFMISQDLRSQLNRQNVARPTSSHHEYANRLLQNYKPYETIARGVIPDDALMSIGAIGIRSYYLADLKIVDIRGLTDATVARLPVTRANHERSMAHDRRATPGYLEERGVNVQIYPAAFSEAQALALANYALQIGPELWMPFDTFDHQWAIERFADRDLRVSNHVTTTINQYEAIISGEMPVLHAYFDLYLRENDISYVKNSCSLTDTETKFFLHIIPQDVQDLSNDRKPYGFDNFDFSFYDHGVRLNGTCIVSVDLPAYEIKRIITGQFISDEGRVWEGDIPLQVYEPSAHEIDAYNQEYEAIIADDPVLRAHFDLYLKENDISYIKNPCSLADTQAKFFLHIFPHNVQDLPNDRQPYGFDNLDFSFFDHGLHFNGNCMATVGLPEYGIKRIVTGQFISGEGRKVWEGEFSVDE